MTQSVVALPNNRLNKAILNILASACRVTRVILEGSASLGCVMNAACKSFNKWNREKTALKQPVVWSLPLKSLLGIIVAAYRVASLCPQKRNREKTAVTQRVAASQNRPWWPRGPDPKAARGPALALTLLWACSTKCTAYKNKIQLLQITNTTLQNARRTKYKYRKSQLLYKMHGLQNPTTTNHKYCSTKYMNQKALDLFPPIHISTSQ